MHHMVGMAEIAEILGVTRQRVAQLIETYDDFPKPEVELSGGRVWSRTAIETWIASHPERGPGRAEEGRGKRGRFLDAIVSAFSFERFTDRARNSIVKGQEEARLMNHNYIGTEHLLLGLLAIGEGIAYEALTDLSVSLPIARGQIEHMIGKGTSTPQGHIPFTPRAKKVLELALREARTFEHNYIGTEHVLLALIRERDGVAWKALEAMGVSSEDLRNVTVGRMSGMAAPRTKPREAAPDEDLKCSFCGKSRHEVQKLVAGPGVYICNECIVLCEQIIEGEGVETEATKRQHDLQLRIDDLERRLGDLEKK